MNSRRRTLSVSVLLALAVLSIVLTPVTSFAQEDAKALAEHLRSKARSNPTSIFSSVSRLLMSTPDSPIPPDFVRRTRVLRDGDRWSTQTKDYVGDPAAGPLAEAGFIKDDRIMMYQVQGDKPPAAIHIMTNTQASSEKSRAGFGMDRIFDGYYPGNGKRIDEILDQPGTRTSVVGHDTIDGRKVIGLEVQSDHGVYVFWLDESINYQPRKITISKLAEHRHEGRTAADFSLSPKDSPTEKIDIEVYPIAYLPSDYGMMPVSAEYSETYHLKNGKEIKAQWATERNYEAWPKTSPEKLSFFREIPDGVTVYDDHFPGVEFIWQQGKILSVTPPDMSSTAIPVEVTSEVTPEETTKVALKPSTDPTNTTGKVAPIATQDEPANESSNMVWPVITGLVIVLIAGGGWYAIRKKTA